MFDGRILKESFELRKGKHLYVFDPSGFDNKRLGEEDDPMGSPVFYLDDRLICAFEESAVAIEGPVYLICGCDDYKERERKFDAGETYKKQRYIEDFEWDCVATCEHIALINRYFRKPLMEKALEEFVKENSNELNEYLKSREAGIFPRTAAFVFADYLKKQGR